MALSLQNLFSSASEDFDDEEFLSALEVTEPNFSINTPTTPVRLRPISARDTQRTGGSSSLAKPLFSEETAHVQVHANSTDTSNVPSLEQDLNDEELLSACSELEAGVSQDQYRTPGQTPNPRLCLRPINQTSENNSFTSNSASFQLRSSGGNLCSDLKPRTFTRHLQDSGHTDHQSCGFSTNSPTASNFHGGGRGHYQSPGPTAKRPCWRPSLETQPVTPARAGVQPTYSRCTTPAAAVRQTPSWQGGAGSNTLPKTPQMPSRPNQSGTLQTPVVTNHLVQLVEAANKTPRVLPWETPPPKERRFPGPAGLLPQQGSGRRLDEILISTPHTPSHGARARHRSKENTPSKEPVAEEFGRGPWATMKAELSLDENDASCFLRTYSVVMVLRKAALKQLPKNKVPRMAVALKSLTPANGDASAVFRDATGEIQGTVHHLLLEERESELKAGSVLLLQQVGVFSPSHRNHYLNVTPSNLVKIYPTGGGSESSTVSVEWTTEETVDVNSNDTQSHQGSFSIPTQCRPLEQIPSLSSSTTQCRPLEQGPSLSSSTTRCRPLELEPSLSSGTTQCRPLKQVPSLSSSTTWCRPLELEPCLSSGTTRCRPLELEPSPSSSTTQFRPLELEPSFSYSTTQPGINWPAVSPFLTSTALSRGHQPSSNIIEYKAPHPVESSICYSSVQQLRTGPAAICQSTRTVQTKASTPSFSAAQNRTSPAADNADWDMDDLDTLLCDLPEDPGE